MQRLSSASDELARVVHRLLSRPVEGRYASGRAAARALAEATPERAAVETRLSLRLLSSAYAPSAKETPYDLAAAF
ncbi:MAG: hypothetical protein H5U40_13515 [Polyangiaceae bacterium]|nr:hypothetical protein [Polyangiaceae bacterium]